MEKKIYIDKLINYIMLICTLYLGQLGVIVCVKYVEYASVIILAGCLIPILIGIPFFIVKRVNVSVFEIVIGLLLILNYFLTMLLNHDYRIAYGLMTLNVLDAVFYSMLYKREDFYKAYIYIMATIIIMSGVATYLILPCFREFLTSFHNSNQELFWDLWFAFPLEGDGMYRLNCIWNEPGIFAVYTMFALLLAFFYVDTNVFIKVVLVLGMLLSGSSTGYVVLLLVMGTYVLDEIIKRRRWRIMIWFALIGIALILGCYYVFTEQFMYVISKYSVHNISFIGRFAPMLYNMECWLKSPIWGNGFSEGFFRVNNFLYQGVLFCNTSTTTNLFNQFGFFVPVMSILASCRIAAISKKNILVMILIFFILVLGVNFEDQTLDAFYVIMLFSVFMKDDEKVTNKRACCES